MLKIAYYPTGKIATIHIQISDHFTQVPYNPETQLIDWNSIDYEPTKNSIKTAWDEWVIDKNLTIELRDRPDLALVQPKPSPDWGVFKRNAFISPAFVAILKNTTDQFSVVNLRDIITPLGYSPLENTDYPILYYVWNMVVDGLVTPLIADQVLDMNIIAENSNMIFRFDSDGKMYQL